MKIIVYYLLNRSPPAWMKVNSEMNGSALPNGLINDTRIYQAWANYYVKWMEAYENSDITFWLQINYKLGVKLLEFKV